MSVWQRMYQEGKLTEEAYRNLMEAHRRNEEKERLQQQTQNSKRDLEKEQRKKEYYEYLQSEQWKWMRDVCLEYYRHSCAVCNSHQNLKVHHRTYERLFYELPSDLIVLCDKCHAKFHDKLPTIDTEYHYPVF